MLLQKSLYSSSVTSFLAHNQIVFCVLTCFHSHTVFLTGLFSSSSSFSSFADIRRPLQEEMTVALPNGYLILQAASMYRTGSQGTSTTMRAFLEQRSSPSSPADTDLDGSANACGWRAGSSPALFGSPSSITLLYECWVFTRTAAFTFKHQSAAEKKLNYTSRFVRVIFAQELANTSASFLCQCSKTASNLRRLQGGQTVLCFFSSVLLTCLSASQHWHETRSIMERGSSGLT